MPSHLTLEDNHRVSGWPECGWVFFPQTEHSVILMMEAEWLVMCKREIIGAEKSEVLRPADNTVQTVSQRVVGQSVGCTVLIASLISDVCFQAILTSFFLSQLVHERYVALNCFFLPL